MKAETLSSLKNQISVESKNGIDFTISATLIWAIIAVIWATPMESYQKSIWVFMAGTPLLPLAFLLSKVLKTNWKISNNPLQSLGLWLNFAQLFYFPFLIFILSRMPEYFLMTYAIITGAHFFPYSWFFNTKCYAIFAGIISIGSMLAGSKLPTTDHFQIAAFCSLSIGLMTLSLIFDYKLKKSKATASAKNSLVEEKIQLELSEKIM